MEYSMVWVRGHIEYMTGPGASVFSADNEREAWRSWRARLTVLPSPVF